MAQISPVEKIQAAERSRQTITLPKTERFYKPKTDSYPFSYLPTMEYTQGNWTADVVQYVDGETMVNFHYPDTQWGVGYQASWDNNGSYHFAIITNNGIIPGVEVAIPTGEGEATFGSTAPAVILTERDYWRGQKMLEVYSTFRRFVGDPDLNIPFPRMQIPKLLNALQIVVNDWTKTIAEVKSINDLPPQ